jgi:hypothetical protein
VASVLKTCLTASDYGRLTGGEASTMRRWVDKIPTDKLLEISDRLRTAIAENIAEADQRFAWRMLGSHIHMPALVSSSEILLRPLIPPTWSHALANAKQRIFMMRQRLAPAVPRAADRPAPRSTASNPEGWERHRSAVLHLPEKSLEESEVLNLRHEMMRRAGRSIGAHAQPG